MTDFYSVLPHLNATLNASSFVLLSSGYYFIKRKRVQAHRNCQLAALTASVVFLISYIVYHAHHGATRFPGQGIARPIYFTILITHTFLAALFIIVPFLTWYGTWFGRDLSDQDIAAYLSDEKNPRHIQHALSRVEERIERGDPSAQKFYPQIVALAQSPTGEIRKTAAWVMGQDNKSSEFHQKLISLLSDTEPLVRRNVALRLVRFGDASDLPELRSMLQSFESKSTIAGRVVSLLGQGSRIKAGGLLARIRDTSNAVQELRSPVDGAIGRLGLKEGDAVAVGQTVA